VLPVADSSHMSVQACLRQPVAPPAWPRKQGQTVCDGGASLSQSRRRLVAGQCHGARTVLPRDERARGQSAHPLRRLARRGGRIAQRRGVPRSYLRSPWRCSKTALDRKGLRWPWARPREPGGPPGPASPPRCAHSDSRQGALPRARFSHGSLAPGPRRSRSTPCSARAIRSRARR